MDEIYLQLYAFIPQSDSNGPGCRCGIWVQGCSLNCPGCFNPETHPADLGERVAVSDLCNRVISLGDSIEGITISGGEPLEQIDALTRFLGYIKKHSDLSVLLFSGYNWDEISKMQHSDELLSCVDVLIAGRYEETLRSSTGLVGSTNQTVHLLTGRYSLDDLSVIPSGEVIITDDGQVIITGIDPLKYELTTGERTNGF